MNKKTNLKPVGKKLVKVKKNIHYLVVAPGSIFNSQEIIVNKQIPPFEEIEVGHHIYKINEVFFCTEDMYKGRIILLPVDKKYEYVYNELGGNSEMEDEGDCNEI